MNDNKPNIIYILADDMGYGDVSCLNKNSKIRTPNFDSIADNGMIFTDAHSSSAVCTPSRYSILTGRYNWRSALKSGVLGGYSPSLIEKGRTTVASMLKTCNYNTACIGKWHLGMDWKFDKEVTIEPGHRTTLGVDYSAPIKNGPIEFGFDYYYGISGSLDMPPYVYIENNQVTELPTNMTANTGKKFWRNGPTAPNFKHEEVLPTLTKKVLDQIDQWEDEPFFIYYPLPAPHTPILPTKKFQGQTNTNEYGDFVLMCDDVVGQIVNKLKEKGLYENTILIYTSDNGCSPEANFEELKNKGHNPNHIFRGHKADIYEGGHRIPLLIQWPKKIKPKSVINEPVCLTDFAATVADIVDYNICDNECEDSVSNIDLWLGDEYSSPLREATVHHSINGSFSIRKENWKLEMCPGSGGWSFPKPEEDTQGLPPIQLYDLSKDIGEQVNVQELNPEVVEELKNLLIKYIKDGRSTKGKPQKNTDPEWIQNFQWINEV
ncbi:arylsulfatase [Vallitaleaceae bacterium 9-2]